MENLTGISNDIWGSMSTGGKAMSDLSAEEQQQRKKKLMAAGQSSDFQNAMSYLFGTRLNSAGTPRA